MRAFNPCPKFMRTLVLVFTLLAPGRANVCADGWVDGHVCASSIISDTWFCIYSQCSSGPIYQGTNPQCPDYNGLTGSIAQFCRSNTGDWNQCDRYGILQAAYALYGAYAAGNNVHQYGILMGPQSSPSHWDRMFNWYPAYGCHTNPPGLDCQGNFQDFINVNENAASYSIACKYPVPSPSPPPSNPSGAGGDPHITFANGGRADFRGSDQDNYVFISSPGYQFAPFFQEVDFHYTSPTAVTQLVHGTFMTQAHWRVRASNGDELFLSTDALKRGELQGRVASGSGLPDRSIKLRPWSSATFGDVRLATRMLTVSVESPAWQVNATSKPIWGLAVPQNASHRNGVGEWDEELLAINVVKRQLWAADQRRIDIAISGAFPQPGAHGIIGQSYRDPTVRNGRIDSYGSLDHPELVASDGTGPEMRTLAQAEGAIDGVHTDYKLGAPFSTRYKFSQYDSNPSSVNVSLSKRMASTSEWEGPGRAR